MEEHDGNVSIGGRNITNLRFAENKDALAEEETGNLSKKKNSTKPAQGISAEKTKLMTNSANDIQREIKVKGRKLGNKFQASWSSCFR